MPINIDFTAFGAAVQRVTDALTFLPEVTVYVPPANVANGTVTVDVQHSTDGGVTWIELPAGNVTPFEHGHSDRINLLNFDRALTAIKRELSEDEYTFLPWFGPDVQVGDIEVCYSYGWFGWTEIEGTKFARSTVTTEPVNAHTYPAPTLLARRRSDA